MVHQYRNATIRALIATVLVAVWVIWYEGPVWAWALLIGYIAFTFFIALVIARKVDRAISARETSDDR